MSSEAITRNDLENILNEVVPPEKIGITVESKKLIWTNPSPSSAFAGQSFNVGAGYDLVEVETTEGMVVRGSGSIGCIRYGWSNGAVVYARSMSYTKSSGGFWCDNGIIAGIANITSFTIDNNSCKPWKIYGIKLVQI